MSVSEYIPIWEQLSKEHRSVLEHAVTKQHIASGTVVHNGKDDCFGVLVIVQGQLRVYTMSEEGKEITLYRLWNRDICLFSASCMLQSIEFDVTIQAEQDTEFYHIPVDTYKHLMKESAPLANYTNEIMASRFSDVMWLMDQILYKRQDSRMAAFLLEESDISGEMELKLTHEEIAHHLGSAREVVTRMLKYFQTEGIVSLSRGNIKIVNRNKLVDVARDSIR
ncbi:MAG: Crp/Fnr family transcriptional regulator [Lachnospiraceae bacterium]